jgi:hypothetical protein
LHSRVASEAPCQHSTFYSDDRLRGKPVRVRFTWSNITANSAHWEQVFSPDGGKTREVNWITDFKRPR